MRKASEAQLARLKANQAAVFKDTAVILTFSQDVGADYRQTAGAYVAGSSIAVGYKPVTPKEGNDDQGVPMITGRLRLPVGTAVTGQDRVRITHIAGEALAAALDFAIYGEPKRRPTVVLCDLAMITDGSTGA